MATLNVSTGSASPATTVSPVSIQPVDSPVTTNPHPTQAEHAYWEHVNAWINHDGYIHSEVRLEGTELTWGGFHLGLLPTEVREVYSAFEMHSWDSSDPYSRNTWITLWWSTNNADDATYWSNTFIGILNQFLIIEYEWDYTFGHDEGGNQYVCVGYNAHVDFNGFTDVIEASLPTELGGVASNINVTDASSLTIRNNWAFNGGFPVMEIGVSFNDRMDAYSGGHTVSTKELTRLNSICKSPYSDSMHVGVALPNVDNLAANPTWGHDDDDYRSDLTVRDWGEPWDLDHWNWYDLEIKDHNYVPGDVTLTFDYEFIPWHMMPMIHTNIDVDPKGVVGWGLSSSGENATFYTVGTSDAFWNDVEFFSLNIVPYLGHSHTGDANAQLGFASGVTDVQAAGDAFFTAYMAALGLVAAENSTNGHNYYIDFEHVLPAQLSTIMASGAQANDVFAATDLSNVNSIREYHNYDSEFGGMYGSVELQYDPKAAWIESPPVTFADTGAAYNYTIDPSVILGWSSMPFDDDYYQASINLEFPTQDTESFGANTQLYNGWGYWVGKWDYDTSWGRKGGVNLNQLTANPEITDQYGEKTGVAPPLIAAWSIFDFLDENADIEAPWISNRVYDDPNLNYLYSDYTSADGYLAWVAGDESEQYYDDSLEQWVERYTPSGVSSLNASMYFSELTLDMPPFYYDLDLIELDAAIVNNDHARGWYSEFNTTALADGWWTLVADAEDNAGNHASSQNQILVDNYEDGTTTPAEIVYDACTPLDLSTVNGSIWVNFTVSDDIGVFYTMVTLQFAGYIVDEDSPGHYYFEIDTTRYDDLTPLNIIIEVRDLDGHMTTQNLQYMVQNRLDGSAPTVTIISPTPSEIISGIFTFVVDAQDDFEIASVIMQVNDRNPMVMEYDASTDTYRQDFDTNVLLDDTHSLSVVVEDNDLYPHQVVVTTSFMTDNGNTEAVGVDAPDWRNYLGPHNQSFFDFRKDEAAKDSVTWSVEAKDDIGIESVELFIVSDLEGYSAANIDELDYDAISARLGASVSMDATGTDGDWTIYSVVWDSMQLQDGLAAALIRIGDSDTNQKTTEFIVIFLVDNGQDPQGDGDDADALLPGFTLLSTILQLAAATSIVALVRKLRSKPRR